MCEAYFSNPQRGFSSSTARVFTKLKGNGYQDLLTPARQQFMGQGSCGNGGAMRVSPAALYGCRDEATLIQVSGLCQSRYVILFPTSLSIHSADQLGVYKAYSLPHQWSEWGPPAVAGSQRGSADPARPATTTAIYRLTAGEDQPI